MLCRGRRLVHERDGLIRSLIGKVLAHALLEAAERRHLHIIMLRYHVVLGLRLGRHVDILLLILNVLDGDVARMLRLLLPALILSHLLHGLIVHLHARVTAAIKHTAHILDAVLHLE